jgi:hypothetical protein
VPLEPFCIQRPYIFVNAYGAQESIPPAYVAWQAGTTKRIVVLARQAKVINSWAP